MNNRGKSQLNRGRRGEYKVKNILNSYGYNAIRVPLSGSGGIKGDIIATKGNKRIIFEVKTIKNLPALLRKQITSWQEEKYDIIFAEDMCLLVASHKWWLEKRNTLKVYKKRCKTKATTVKLPKILINFLKQAQSENALLFLVPYRSRQYIIIEQL